MSGFKHTGAAAANAAGQYVEYAQNVTALALKANSGANTDITSLSSPALGGATATTQATTDNSTKVATTAYARANDIGVDQSWQIVTGSRVLGGTYTNSTGKPIQVSVTVTNTVASSTVAVNGAVNGIDICSQSNISASSVGFTALNVCFIVPTGAFYYVTGTQISLSSWQELR
jgi:hypothetical protein